MSWNAGTKKVSWPARIKVQAVMKSRIVLGLGVVILLLAGGAYILFGAGAASQNQPNSARRNAGRPVPVVVATAERKTLPLTIRTVGNALAYATVTIKSRVDGQIMQIHFKDGQRVKKGDLLYTIDPRPFEMQLNQAQSILARDRAQLANARANLKRTEELRRRGVATQQQLDLNRTTAAALDETLKSDQAAIDGIRLQLEYTSIRSPLDGRAAETQVDAGNLVKANDVALVVINQTRPLKVAFSVPEQYAFEIHQRMASHHLEVDVSDRNADRPPQKGVVTFLNNTIDSATGTVAVRATLDNTDESILPGQFVTVALRLATIPNAVTVPSQAIQVGQKGTYVFIVKPDKTVDLRAVTTGETVGPDTIVRTGLEGGEQVVTDGQLGLFPGARAAPTVAAKAPKKEQSR